MADVLSSAQAIVAAELAQHPERACFTCSFQSEDVVVLDLLRAVYPRIPVLFLETGYHFKETLEYRDRLTREWDLNLVNLVGTRMTSPQEHGIQECCQARKVEPLLAGLAPYETWFTGLRREQSPSRANLQPVEQHSFPNGLTLRKVSPVYDWMWRDIEAYMAANDIPALPLYAQGYTSIGCEPCTAKPEAGEHARSGRWGGAKLECGLHTVSHKDGD